MPNKILKLASNETLTLRFRVPKRGKIRYYVESDVPVSTYVVDKNGLEEFLDDKPIASIVGGFTNRRVHEEELELDFNGHWHLLIANQKDEAAAVSYEVYY